MVEAHKCDSKIAEIIKEKGRCLWSIVQCRLHFGTVPVRLPRGKRLSQSSKVSGPLDSEVPAAFGPMASATVTARACHFGGCCSCRGCWSRPPQQYASSSVDIGRKTVILGTGSCNKDLNIMSWHRSKGDGGNHRAVRRLVRERAGETPLWSPSAVCKE